MSTKSLDLPLFKLDQSHVKKATELSTRSFLLADEDWFRYLMPDEKTRERNVYYLMEYTVRFCLKYGELYARSENLEAIVGAIYYDEFKPSLLKNLSAGAPRLLRRTTKLKYRRLFKIVDFYEKIHIKNIKGPHFEGSILAAEPKSAGKGIYVMRQLLKKIEEIGVPLYGQTQYEKNLKYYQRLGFKIIEENTLPGTNLRIWDIRYDG